MKTIPHWIDGQEYEGSPVGRFPVENPGTGEVEAELLQASPEDLDHAVAVARRAQKEWAKVSLAKRTAIMFRMRQLVLDHQDEMARLIVAEHGKNYSDAIGEIQRGRETLDFATSINVALKGECSSDISTGVDIHTLRQPVGVVGGICPFNFPAMVPMWMHPLAIATGNAVVMKPASATPSAMLLTARLYKEAGLPDGVFNVVSGNRSIVSGILEHPGIDAISFVGSTPVAHIVQNIGVTHGKRVQALGGANNHAIVMPDCDLDFAAQHLSAAAFGAAGERCMALPVVVAVGGCGPELARKVKAHAERIKVGYGMDEGVEMGPVIDAKAKEFIVGLVNEGEADGGEVVLDGRGLVVPGHEKGHFVGPTIVDNVPVTSRLYREEVFGPVLTIVHADTYEEAIAIVNASEFGNGSAIFTNDGGVARRFTLDVEAGMVGVNVPIPTPVAYYSFGGWKESLLGDHHIHGPEGVRFYTRAKAVTTRWPSEKTYAATMSFQREE
ncbi:MULTISPECIES: CoA-acylating methylmalonate-semialdehyde dehydrogenase [unclassified Actinomyces]|uniref:CoA-acylating methylmalonate-semialdehyde dehydrogenase n=1 Tax=unclassified Actinomyces TaxID=2609248 RepID=UPI0020173CEE|nr:MULTISPECIES: CoA-acylating methylmalonate-semialdehyde dehydrogenase [unclassified Actinomyces]MCL3777605.1 CoA-acylating methylmalonate-semialdehyde dehydrogenase [Actinomyces sp. AC-20-1]MCL3789425.1 CoA-acylating methylmalonate-semialdehyde dehydrogenase [Actinomyces sp. 187325]MCL3791195.1 CoA-acylating methylmalonate-semialdehyde dehydrogenase [Actinomyces sp. 186855]MCL3794411.1 CoA-acylating methylmalonate-semialdehyde dehydrogenase [Actinomyces sp. 217892]